MYQQGGWKEKKNKNVFEIIYLTAHFTPYDMGRPRRRLITYPPPPKKKEKLHGPVQEQ